MHILYQITCISQNKAKYLSLKKAKNKQKYQKNGENANIFPYSKVRFIFTYNIMYVIYIYCTYDIEYYYTLYVHAVDISIRL